VLQTQSTSARSRELVQRSAQTKRQYGEKLGSHKKFSRVLYGRNRKHSKRKKKENDDKEKELKVLLDELKNFSENGGKGLKPAETPKKKEIPKMEIKSFPASSYSFNFGIRQNQSKDRIVLNRSLNNGEKSSRSSNISGNTSMVIES
jgi:hypothetical protein